MSFFSSQEFLIPFLSTLFASLTVIFIQFCNFYISEKKKKLYAMNHISIVCSTILHSELIIKVHTILPHIEAIKRIIKGDKKLQETMFLSDEFDILTEKPLNLNLLPEEYKILIGCDDVSLLHLFEMINHQFSNEQRTQALNKFVTDNLKRQNEFLLKDKEQQEDCLVTYWDYLSNQERKSDRIIFLIVQMLVPVIFKYIKSKQFFFFSTIGIDISLQEIRKTLEEYKEFLPKDNFLEETKTGGIQRAL